VAAIETFGVDSTVIARYAPAYVTGAGTPVTSTQLTALITDTAAVECAYLHSIGITPATLAAQTDTQGYRLIQRLIALGVCVDLIGSWEGAFRNPELARLRREQYDAQRAEIRERIASLGDARPLGDGAPGAVSSHVTMRSRITTALENAPLRQRLAYRGEV